MLTLFTEMNRTQVQAFYDLITSFLTEPLGDHYLKLAVTLTKAHRIGCIYNILFDQNHKIVQRYRFKTAQWRTNDGYSKHRESVAYYIQRILKYPLPAIVQKEFAKAIQNIEEENI